MRLRLLGFIFSTLAALILPSWAQAQLYMSGAGGVYSNLESTGLAGRFALGAEPLDWIKVEGSALATGHDQACRDVCRRAHSGFACSGVAHVAPEEDCRDCGGPHRASAV